MQKQSFYLINKTKGTSTKVKTPQDFHLTNILKIAAANEVVELCVIVTESLSYYGIDFLKEKLNLLKQEILNDNATGFIGGKERLKLYKRVPNRIYPKCDKCECFTENNVDLVSIRDTGMCISCRKPKIKEIKHETNRK